MIRSNELILRGVNNRVRNKSAIAHRKSGTEDARAPNPSRLSYACTPRASVWSACVFSAALIASLNLPFVTLAASSSDWPGWRGPTQDGIATPGQYPPTQWSESENVLWKVPIPGRGHGSPTVVGSRIYLATSDPVKLSQSVLCLDRESGKTVWTREVHASGGETGKHQNSSAASSTVACDGERLFINFLNNGAIYTTALDLKGKQIWQKKICDYQVHQGYGASPVIYEGLVLVSADHRGGGVLAGLDLKSGEIVWTQQRPKIPNYTTPAVVKAAGKTQMVLGGCNMVASYDPATGKKLWELEGSTEECVTTAVSDGERIIATGGYPRNHVVAVKADGSRKVDWQLPTRLYVPSPIVKEGHIYGVLDSGFAVCWKADTGAELWKERLGGDFYSSPVMVGDQIYASNVAGKTYVFEATPKSFKLICQNQLGEEMYASPVVCGSRVYLRVAKKGVQRQELLYCVGK